MATYQKRGGSWRAIIRRKGSTPQSASFPRKSDAEKWAANIEGRIDRGEFRGDSKLTVAKLFERYRDEVSTSKAGAKWEKLRLDRFLRTVPFRVKTLDRLTSQDIKNWRDKRVTEVQGSSANRELNLMSAVFSHARGEWGIVMNGNPVKGVKRPTPPRPRNRRITSTELAALWTGAGGMKVPPRKRGQTLGYVVWLFEFGIETAMRLGEMCALRWDQVNLIERWVFVDKSKNGDARHVPLTPRAKEILETLDQRDDLVFPVPAGSAGSTFYKLVRRVGIAELTLHDTRHEGVSRLSKKLSVLELSKAVGHRDLKSLLVYYNPTGKELADKLNS